MPFCILLCGITECILFCEIRCILKLNFFEVELAFCFTGVDTSL